MLVHTGDFCQWDLDSPWLEGEKEKKKKSKYDIRLQLPILGGR